MEIKNIINYSAIFIFFISMALSFCALPFLINSNYIIFALIFQIAFFLFLIFYNYNIVLIEINNFYKHKECKYILLFLLTIFVTSIIVLLFGGNAGLFKVIISVFFRAIRILFPLFFGYFITKRLKNQRIISILYTIIFIIFLYGIIEYLVFLFDFSFFKPIFKFLVNSHINATFDKPLGYTRLQSSFGEPSYFAFFIVLFLPIIYTISFNKIKIYKNKNMNIIIKKICPILAIIMLFMTQSPIYIIAGIIVSILYFIFNSKQKKLILYCALIFLLVSITVYFNWSFLEELLLSNKVGARIVQTLISCTSLDLLVINEPSLATRIISYLYMIDIFKHYPLTGCGIGNYTEILTNYFLSSKYPLTEELTNHLATGQVTLNSNIFFQTLADSGIFATFFLYSFYYRIIKRVRYYVKKLPKENILQSFLLFLCVFIVLSLYDSNLFSVYTWVLFGVIIAYCDNIQSALKIYFTNLKK